MSINDDWEGLQLTWRIENFRYLEGNSIPSPSFRLYSTIWQAVILNQNNNISFELRPFSRPLIPGECIFHCSFALLESDDIPLIWRERKQAAPNGSVYFNKFVNKDLLSSKKSILDLNDTLTVQCCIWRTPRGLIPLEYYAITRMEPGIEHKSKIVVEETFIWEVANVSSLRPLQFFEREVIGNGESLHLKLSLNDEDEFEVTVIKELTLITTHVKIIIAVLNVSGRNIEFANHECEFVTKGQEWTFDTNLSKAMLMRHQTQFLPEDTLSLQFTCTFSKNSDLVTFNRLVDLNEFLELKPTDAAASEISEATLCADELETDRPNESHPPKTVFQTLQDMYSEGFLSDFNLKVGDRVFPVHRCFLGARSQVFRAMFTTEMKEKQDNCVDIEDVDVDTLRSLLQFVYSDRLEEDMGWEDASSLYVAADKYALEPLKQECSAILKSGMSVPSVLDVLSMADMHQDQDLKSAALDFVSLNDIVGSELWSRFEEKNAPLALETCRELYLKEKTNCSIGREECTAILPADPQTNQTGQPGIQIQQQAPSTPSAPPCQPSRRPKKQLCGHRRRGRGHAPEIAAVRLLGQAGRGHGWEDASSLYAAADKYALEPLKQECSAILKSGMSVSNVLDVLSMADMHQDQDLKSAALDFVSLNDIVGSELWSRFEEKNAPLALETCRN